MKICIACQAQKDLSEFYKHSQTADKYFSKCKECTKSDVRANYALKREQYAEYERLRFHQPKRKADALKHQRLRRAQHPDKYFAHGMVNNAIRDKRLFKQPCEVCGVSKVQAHHDDYSRPLEVKWLCRKHHLELHGKTAYQEQNLTPARCFDVAIG